VVRVRLTTTAKQIRGGSLMAKASTRDGGTMETVNMVIAVAIIAASWILLDKALRHPGSIAAHGIPGNVDVPKGLGAAGGQLNSAASSPSVVENRPVQTVGRSASSLR
jgi:hypothetical protein